MKRSTSTNLFGIVVISLLMIFAISTDANAQGRGRRASNWDKKCSKFVNCHDARDGRWDGRGPRDRALVVQMFSAALVATVIPIVTGGSADVVIVTAIGVTIAIGVAAAKGKIAILDTLWMHSHNGLPGILRMWRNWQTRRSQKPVMVTSWRFKSSHPHQTGQRKYRSYIACRTYISFYVKIFVTDFRRLVFS